MNSEQAAMAGNRFNQWQPMIAIIALPSNLSRTQSNKLLTHFDWHRYKRYRHILHHEAMGGVTRSCWYFWHLTRHGNLFPSEKIMKDNWYARTLQTALDNTVGEGWQSQTLKVFSEGESRAHHNAWGQLRVPRFDDWALIFDRDGLVPDLVDLPLF